MERSFLYKGKCFVLQHPDVTDAFQAFVQQEQPDRIIEIGSAYGGLTMILADTAPKTPIYTFEIRDICCREVKERPNVMVRAADVFDPVTEAEIVHLIQREGKVWLLCDGDNKVKEFNTFARYLKPGDTIMAHDYEGHTCEWDLEEIADRDIAKTVMDEGLLPSMKETMAAVAWTSWKKTCPHWPFFQPDPLKTRMIPRIIHQMWIGPRPIPLEMMQSWKEMNPSWDYILWDESRLRSWPFFNRKLIDETPELYDKCDIMRYEILYALGGFFPDADSICRKPLEDHLFEYDCASCFESETNRGGLITNSFLSAQPGCQLMELCIQELMALSIQRKNEPTPLVWWHVGPAFLTHMVQAYQYPIKIWPSHYFIPKHHAGIMYQGPGPVYCDHKWGSSSHHGYDHGEPPTPLYISGNLWCISGYGTLVYEIIKGLRSLNLDVRINRANQIDYETCPNYFRSIHLPRPDDVWEIIIVAPCDVASQNVGKRSVIFTMWETDRLDKAWVDYLNKAALVIVPSQWSVESFKKSGVTIPIYKVPLGFDPLIFNKGDSYPAECIFGTAASLGAGGLRKNTDQVVRLFQQAFPDTEKVKLKIKITPNCLWNDAGDSRVEVTKQFLKPLDLADWYRNICVFVNCSNAEGFGLHLIEAMACGRPIISTKYSAVTEYFDESVGYVADHTIVPACGGPYSGHWGKPDDESIIKWMRHIYHNRDEAMQKGEAASLRAKEFTWKNTAIKLMNTLKENGVIKE